MLPRLSRRSLAQGRSTGDGGTSRVPADAAGGLADSAAPPGALVRGQERQDITGYNVPEELALSLGLLFRVLTPMRSRPRMRQVAERVEAMEKEEASYWLGIAIHRKNPRRVLTALWYLLTDPLR